MAQPANEFLDTEQSLAPGDLVEVEQAFGFTFPGEIRAHYLAINGGSPRKYHFEKDGSIYVVQSFLPIKYGRGKGHFEDVNRDLKVEANILPQHLFAFADDPGGDFYCFSTRTQDAGSVWIYRGEYSDEPDRAVQFLAPSLSEFIGGMTEDKG